MLPPLTLKKGLIPSKTSSMPDALMTSASGFTFNTSVISGMRSFSVFSMPIFMVVADAEQLLQAPWSSSFTTLPSMSTILQLPPSLIRYGRMTSRTMSTFSQVRGSFGSSASGSGSPIGVVSGSFLSASNGEIMGSSTAASASASKTVFEARPRPGEALSPRMDAASVPEAAAAKAVAKKTASPDTEGEAAAGTAVRLPADLLSCRPVCMSLPPATAKPREEAPPPAAKANAMARHRRRRRRRSAVGLRAGPAVGAMGGRLKFPTPSHQTTIELSRQS
mmetsp:Transcript_90404/g.163017  ORF Transcript_90404/g.163017 Transcript_90404/m.163017 type:complete len:278 (+) Transcript_90404:59-892(+)